MVKKSFQTNVKEDSVPNADNVPQKEMKSNEDPNAHPASTVPQSLSDGLSAVTDGKLDVKSLMEAVKIIAKQEEIKVTAKYSAATGAITGVSSVVGGLVLTPIGLTGVGFLVGVGVGSLTSFLLFKDKYYSLVEIIDSLPEKEQEKLAEHLRKGLKSINVVGLLKLTMLLQSNDKALFELMKFLIKTYHTEFFKLPSENGTVNVNKNDA